MTDRTSLNWQVLDLINDLVAERGITKSELVLLSGMKRNTLFVKLRGETALTTDDIARLCDALGADAELVLRKAWEGRMNARPSNVTAIHRNVPGSVEDLTMRRPRTMDRTEVAAAERDRRETDSPAPGESPND